jgi:hypothetical protein
MANEFVARKGIISSGSVSLVTGSFVGPLQGTASFATSASFAQTASFALNAGASVFPFTGSAEISGSLRVTDKVGIGIAIPTERRIDVDGGEVRIGQASTGTGAWLSVNLTNGTTASAAGRFAIRSSASDSELIPVTQPNLILNRGSDGLGTLLKFTNQRAGFAGIGSAADADNLHDIRLYSGDGSERLRVNSSGSVGIGTTSPSATLHVNGNVSASSYTGSLQGTASFATSASYALTASFALNGGGGTSETASYALVAESVRTLAEEVVGEVSYTGSLLGTSSFAVSSSYAETASFALNAGAAAFPYTGSAEISGSLLVIGNVSASSYTSSISNAVGFLGTSSFATSASYTETASFVPNIGDLVFPYTGSAQISGSLRLQSTTLFPLVVSSSAGGYASFTSTTGLSNIRISGANTFAFPQIQLRSGSTSLLNIQATDAAGEVNAAAGLSLQLGADDGNAYWRVETNGDLTPSTQALKVLATASAATSASYALTASFALNGGGGGTSETASYALVAESVRTLAEEAVGEVSYTGSLLGTSSFATTATNANNVNLANRTTNESGHLTFTGTTATGNQPSYTNTNIRVNPAVGGITATSFTGSLSGNATTATTATTATNANNVNIANRTTNESGHIAFIGTTATGNQPVYSNTSIRVNPAVAGITATSFTGSLSGNATTATTATTATNANNINLANRTTNESGHLTFTGTTATGNQPSYTNTNIRVNPSLGSITATAFTETSTRKLKDNITPIETQLENLQRLNPVRFTWKETGKDDIGLIAEEVSAIFPEMVEYDQDGNPIGIHYSRLVTILISILKELTSK